MHTIHIPAINPRLNGRSGDISDHMSLKNPSRWDRASRFLRMEAAIGRAIPSTKPPALITKPDHRDLHLPLTLGGGKPTDMVPEALIPILLLRIQPGLHIALAPNGNPLYTRLDGSSGLTYLVFKDTTSPRAFFRNVIVPNPERMAFLLGIKPELLSPGA